MTTQVDESTDSLHEVMPFNPEKWRIRTPGHCATLIAQAINGAPESRNLEALCAAGDIVTMEALKHPETDVRASKLLTAHSVAMMGLLDQLPAELLTSELFNLKTSTGLTVLEAAMQCQEPQGKGQLDRVEAKLKAARTTLSRQMGEKESPSFLKDEGLCVAPVLKVVGMERPGFGRTTLSL